MQTDQQRIAALEQTVARLLDQVARLQSASQSRVIGSRLALAQPAATIAAREQIDASTYTVHTGMVDIWDLIDAPAGYGADDWHMIKLTPTRQVRLGNIWDDALAAAVPLIINQHPSGRWIHGAEQC